jgi:hypothetical protein
MPLRNPTLNTEKMLIRSFRAGDEDAFRALNEEWIEHYFRVEAKDKEVFADARKAILEKGGQVLFAVIGKSGLRPEDVQRRFTNFK